MLTMQPLTMPPQLLEVVRNLPQVGKIKIAAGYFSYLNIDDNFIHSIYPLLDYPGIVKPDYFSAETGYIGAHISITYPEENTQLNQDEENKPITFSAVGLFSA